MSAFRYITVLIWIAWPLSAPYGNDLVQPAGRMRDTAFLHTVHDSSGTILRCTELKTDGVLKLCLNASQSSGRCSEGKFLCGAEITQSQQQCDVIAVASLIEFIWKGPFNKFYLIGGQPGETYDCLQFAQEACLGTQQCKGLTSVLKDDGELSWQLRMGRQLARSTTGEISYLWKVKNKTALLNLEFVQQDWSPLQTHELHVELYHSVRHFLSHHASRRLQQPFRTTRQTQLASGYTLWEDMYFYHTSFVCVQGNDRLDPSAWAVMSEVDDMHRWGKHTGRFDSPKKRGFGIKLVDQNSVKSWIGVKKISLESSVMITDFIPEYTPHLYHMLENLLRIWATGRAFMADAYEPKWLILPQNVYSEFGLETKSLITSVFQDIRIVDQKDFRLLVEDRILHFTQLVASDRGGVNQMLAGISSRLPKYMPSFVSTVLGNTGASHAHSLNAVPTVTFVDRQASSIRRLIGHLSVKLFWLLGTGDAQSGIHFRWIRFEVLSFREQVKRAAETDVLMGVHGNALSHALWIRNPGALIEIFPGKGNWVLAFQQFCEMRGLLYYGLDASSGVVYRDGSFASVKHGDRMSPPPDCAIEGRSVNQIAVELDLDLIVSLVCGALFATAAGELSQEASRLCWYPSINYLGNKVNGSSGHEIGLQDYSCVDLETGYVFKTGYIAEGADETPNDYCFSTLQSKIHSPPGASSASCEVLCQIQKNPGWQSVLKGLCTREKPAVYLEREVKTLLDSVPLLTSRRIEIFFQEGRRAHPSHFRFMARVQIVRGKVYVSEDEELHKDVRGRFNRVVESLYEIISTKGTPDCDFAFQAGDGSPWELLPFTTVDKSREVFVPFFAQDKPKIVKSILAPSRGVLNPDYSAVDWCFKSSTLAWESRKPLAVWRGSTTGGNYDSDSWETAARVKVARLSRKRPDLLDASFVHIQPTSDVFKKMIAEGLSGATLSPVEQQQYKVIIMVDGNNVPDRFAAQLLSGPAVVRQESAHHEYWYEELIPWVNYIPVREELEDLEETLDKVLANDTLLMSVSAAARNFVLDRLSPATISEYWSDVLALYSQHMRGAIVPANGSRLIDPPLRLYLPILQQQLPCGNVVTPPCLIGSRKFVCTSLAPIAVLYEQTQPSPIEGCFGGDLSWGTCTHGKFLCDQSSTSLPPASWNGFFSLKTSDPPMHGSFGFAAPHVKHCDPTMQAHHSSLQHKCSEWKGSKARELACVVYNASMTCLESHCTRTCTEQCNERHERSECSGLCLHWERNSPAVLRLESVRGWGNVFVTTESVARKEELSSGCDLTLLDPVFVLSFVRARSTLDTSLGVVYALYTVLQEFDVGTENYLLFTDVDSAAELGAYASLVLSMTDKHPLFLRQLLKKRLCFQSVIVGVTSESRHDAPSMGQMEHKRNFMLSRMGFFVVKRLAVQRLLRYSIIFPVNGSVARREVTIFEDAVIINTSHYMSLMDALLVKGFWVRSVHKDMSCIQRLETLRLTSCLVGTSETLDFMQFAPRLLGVVEIIYAYDNIPSRPGGTGLAAQLGVRIVYVSLEQVCSPASGACERVLPSFATSEAIQRFWGPFTSLSLKNDHLLIIQQQLPCGNVDENTPPCLIGSRKLVCTSVAPTVILYEQNQPSPREGCFGGDLSWGTCSRGMFLCDQNQSLSRETPRSSDIVIQSECLNGVCALNDMMYYPPWTDSWCPRVVEIQNRLCFGCAALLKSGKYECAGLDDSQEGIVQRAAKWGVTPVPESPLAHLRNGLHKDGSIGVIALDGWPGKCSRHVHGLAVLTYVDGWNLYHQTLQTMRRVFEVLVNFDYTAKNFSGGLTSITESITSHRADFLYGFECTIVLQDQSALSALGPFGSPLLQKLCSHPPVVLQSAHGPVCFSRLILGATPGGWDMQVDRKVSQPVRFSSMVMGELVRMLFRTPRRVLPASGGVGSKVLFVQRKGTREMINYEVVYSRMMTNASPVGVQVVRANFDKMSLVEVIHIVSACFVTVGVHGAGLTNIIFMSLPAALVEVSIGTLRPEFFQLCQSLHVIHYDFTDVVLVGKYDPDPRSMQVFVVDIQGLSALVLHAVDMVLTKVKHTTYP